jgi:hypothetical protein
MIENLKIICVQGAEIHPYILDLARLRIEVFKDYPYLYQGDMEYEMDYVRRFGYEKHPELCAHFEWKEIDKEVSTSKSLVFWLKQL